MILNDMDMWRAALSKCHLSKAVMPTSRGYLIENVDAYNRIQAILDTPEMEHCHKFLYNLDVEDLQEDEIEKIDKLYKLGQDRGFIPPDEPECDETPDDAVQGKDLSAPAKVDAPPPIVQQAIPTPALRTACFTVMYSAMRNGEVKTGEAYSNSVSPRAAKADVLAQLSRIGYDNITILAIEATDPDCVDTSLTGMDTQFVPPAKLVPDIGQVGVALDDENVDEDDMLKGKKHNLHVDEAGEDDNGGDDAKDDSRSDETSKDSDDTSDDEAGDADAGDDTGEEDSEETDDKGTEDQDKGDEEGDDGEELDDAKKSALKDKYKKAFKAAMIKCKFEDKSFDDLTLKEKVDFFTEMSKSWSDDNDPSKFMTSKELESLNKTVMKR